MLLFFGLLLAALKFAFGAQTLMIPQVLIPPDRNIAINKNIHATATCGESNGEPYREMYCQIAGSSPYNPLSQYAYNDNGNGNAFREAKSSKVSFIQGGQVCDYCEANTIYEHPAEFMVDGGPAWWQSPPLSRGKQFEQVNITIDLGQEFHVAYVWIQMANSPRPGKWVLERSVDYGKTYTPWQYFAETAADCQEFGKETLAPILRDDSVICTTEFSSITPLENGEIMIRLLENRPGKGNFNHSEVLQNFARATNIRLRLLRAKTLYGHLISLQKRRDPSVTRRHFYAIKEIFMGGRCVCNGHAATCDVLDVKRPNTLLCRCEHNTYGDQCERCLPGFEQKKWQRAMEDREFRCEPCNCFGHSNECVYEEELDRKHLSLDIHGRYEGGGRCLNCRHHTEGINCNKCSRGYYRPRGKHWNETDVCQPCRCDPRLHNDICEEETGRCECKPQFTGRYCDQCSPGYYAPPLCKPCDCSSNGTANEFCLPINGHCPCKPNYAGTFCYECAPGFTNYSAGCVSCNCNSIGSAHADCDLETGQCVCKTNFAGLLCDRCADGYYNYPQCEYCHCDPSGTETGLCDKKTGACLCRAGFTGSRCDQCDSFYYGYPNCRECGCDPNGSEMLECELKTGECTCRPNFIGRQCNRCKPGYYDYPNCKACQCHVDGSEGLTCDNTGKCFCKPNFQGIRCTECKPNFYNFPLCEECRCNPNGVSKDFGGCDKVSFGKLCECKKNVEGRICDRCKPTFWGLSYQLENGCSPCNCNLKGTLSGQNLCDSESGQCLCKEYVAGRQCNRCAEGYYNLQDHNALGCQPCNCNKGGSVGIGCDMKTGQCTCRPRITGLKCDKTIDDHYIPTLWHHKYEAEDGHTPDGEPARYASDRKQFGNFSFKGFAVFSETQDEVLLDVVVQKPTLYQVLFMYMNPTSVEIEVEAIVVPPFPNSQNAEQSVTYMLQPTEKPTVVSVNKRQPFALNPGTWTLRIKAAKRMFLDYIILLPSEYYEANILKETIAEPCKIGDEHNDCLKTRYPPLPVSAKASVDEDRTFNQVDENGEISLMDKMPSDMLPFEYGRVAHIKPADQKTQIQVELQVPEKDDYVLVLEYNNFQTTIVPLNVEVQSDGISNSYGDSFIEHCPFEVFCRNLVLSDGVPASFSLDKGAVVTITITVPPKREFGLASINLVKLRDWDPRYLKQVFLCTRKNGRCVDQTYPMASNEIVKEVESGPNLNKAVNGEKLPLQITDPKNTQTSFEVESSVSEPGNYVLIVHYYNPENSFLKLPVYLNIDKFYDCLLPVEYCPNQAGCRAVIQDFKRNGANYFYIPEKFEAVFNFNSTQRGPIYIDSVIAVPVTSYNDVLLQLQPVDVSNKFIEECNKNEFSNDPATVSDYCRKNVFSLTTDFNVASFPCKCNHGGSKSFSCEEYGGQCDCRAHIIGRQCDHCESGYYGFPECRKCNCLLGHSCDHRTGQCYCPRYVEGRNCDRCVQYAFGYDPLIGCQLCLCHDHGLDGELGNAQCDPENGQCLCKQNVGGRKCNQCLPGHYGFPYCYPCACDSRGTTEQICDPQSSTCTCKENVDGSSCDHCKPNKYNLEASNPLGCSDCFCFGATDRCRSSNYPVDYVHFDREAWQVSDPKGTLRHLDGQVHYFASPDEAPPVVYFAAPLDIGNDFTASYGLKISYRISSQSKDSTQMTVAADLKLIGYNMTLEHWINGVPSNMKNPLHVHVRLNPENFVFESGAPVKRSDFMLVLFDLNQILIKASYYEKTDLATLTDFEMEIAKNSEDGLNSILTATSVEVCQCPTPYSGDSCQHCADGFYRVKTGTYLGACVACDCNGHSGSCDKNTGICHDCQHHTIGDHCETCEEGYYGNATQGGTYSCLPCACPSPYNNFATSCQVSPRGVLESCTCKEGYAGEKCDRCATGYFGEPNNAGGSCTKCYCNDNNDLTAEGSCDPVSGRCDNCLYNTAGDHCEACEQWYHGLPLANKSCAECHCDRCGSFNCDKETGDCLCKPNIEGKECDRCVADAWGFKRCIGCDLCECGIASHSSQCNESNGQCYCMPGAAGQRCETCDQGYWNYTASGCTKCDCEADLSFGTVCDITTGQCHCQEGATGARCDQCLANYLRIPGFGCKICDECVHSLVADLDELDTQYNALAYTVDHMSPATLAGARIRRLFKAVENNKAILDGILTADSEGWIKEAKTTITKNKESVMLVLARVNDSFEKSNLTYSKSKNLMSVFNKLREELIGRIEVYQWTLNDLRRLIVALQRKPRELFIKDWKREATNILSQMEQESGFYLVPQDLHRKVAKVRERAKGLKDEIAQLINLLNDKNKNITILQNSASDYLRLLQNASSHVGNLQTKQATFDEKQRLFSRTNEELLKVMKKVSDELTTIDESIRSVNAVNNDTVKNVNSIQTLIVELKNVRPLLKVSRRERRVRRELKKIHFESHVRSLEKQAEILWKRFSNTKFEADGALQAANIYSELLETLKNIHMLVDSARDNSTSAKSLVIDQPKAANTSRLKSADMSHSVELIARDLDRLMERDSLVRDNLELQLQMLKEKKSLYEQYESDPRNQTAVESLTNTEKSIEETDAKLEALRANVRKFQSNVTAFGDSTSDTVEQVKKLSGKVDEAKTSYARVKNITEGIKILIDSMNSTISPSDSVRNFKENLQKLKDRVARARDLVQRIRLTVNFTGDSNLELPLSSRVSKSSAYTKIECFIKTLASDGLVLFYGNEEPAVKSSSTSSAENFIVLSLKGGKPHLTVSLGDYPTMTELDININDNNWWKVTAEHIGSRITLAAKRAGISETAEENSQLLVGRSRVFKIEENSGRLFVGGIPSEAKISSEVVKKNFVGEIDNLIINGEYISLWNPTRGRTRNIYGSRMRPLGDAMTAPALTFDGAGYGIMYLPGDGKPQRNTAFSVQFQTYDPDGLLYYTGKENSSNFMALELYKGAVQLSFNLGSGEKKMKSSSKPYNDGLPHLVDVSRRGRRVRLTVDDERLIEGESDGPDFELDVGKNYYIGGLPDKFLTLPNVIPFRGCIKDLKLDSHFVDLSKPKATKNVLPGCYIGVVHTVSFPSHNSYAIFQNVSQKFNFELMFNFKTDQPSGHLMSLQSSAKENFFEFRLADGFLWVAGAYVDKRKIGSNIFSDGYWHFVTVEIIEKTLRIGADDSLFEEFEFNNKFMKENDYGLIHFGQLTNTDLALHGCISNVILNGKLLSFREALIDNVRLSECVMIEKGQVPKTDEIMERIPTTEEAVTSTKSTMIARDLEACTLQRRSIKTSDDDKGQRFGLYPDSRLEYHILPTSFDKKSVFTVQLRSTALHGIIMFSKDERNVDYIALYLVNGTVHFAFNAGHGPVILKSDRYLVDGMWHSIITERFERNGTLYVDGKLEDNKMSPGSSVSINSEPPLYIGGLPRNTSLISSVVRLLPGLKPSFVGCLRNFTLNGIKLDNPKEYGLAPCSDGTEKGTYFGENGGYVVLQRNFNVEPKLTIELEVRPRTKTAVLLSVHGVDSITIQLLNGSVYFSVTYDGKTDTASSVAAMTNALCDGHWHKIKASKTKNVIFLTVDGRSNMQKLRDGLRDMTINAPLYLGGVPKNTNFQFLNTTESYVGCIRYEMNVESKKRKKRVEFLDRESFGDVDLSSCPAN